MIYPIGKKIISPYHVLLLRFEGKVVGAGARGGLLPLEVPPIASIAAVIDGGGPCVVAGHVIVDVAISK